MMANGLAGILEVEGVVFDLDGTLVDSRLDFAALRDQLGCPPDTGVLEFVAALADREAARAAETVIHDFEMAGARAATWMPGARALLECLHGRSLPTAILTRNKRDAVTLTVDSLRIDVDMILTREDCRPKPDPEGLLRIAAHWRCDPSRLVYIGDFRFDLDAARNAGMKACLYLNARNRELIRQADWVIAHFDELTRAFSGPSLRPA
ncbi:HAD family hydrolase [Mangrovitalea sediminis]|uniref:HAD family hydrolase n=1 Tax=Mangrovitalea sediminis TaxID=1982043 RepID=UPI001D0CF085|nr:HAD-IA family hydrolase [Mangrovitalea sediminis]